MDYKDKYLVVDFNDNILVTLDYLGAGYTDSEEDNSLYHVDIDEDYVKAYIEQMRLVKEDAFTCLDQLSLSFDKHQDVYDALKKELDTITTLENKLVVLVDWYMIDGIIADIRIDASNDNDMITLTDEHYLDLIELKDKLHDELEKFKSYLV